MIKPTQLDYGTHIGLDYKCVDCGVTKTTKKFHHVPKSSPPEYANICRQCYSEKVRNYDAAMLRTRLRTKAERLEEKIIGNKAKASRKSAAKIAVKKKLEKKKELTASAQADKELASRILAKRRLLYFIQKFVPKYEAGWVHKDICARLERFLLDVIDKKSPRLMLFLPPRSGKSEIVSKNFPAWLLGHRPDFEVIASSYAVSLPMDFSRYVKDLIRDPVYKNIFPNTVLKKDTQSTERWMTTKAGGYVAAGISAPITGKGAHVFIIDDPVKDAEEADSEKTRQRNWSWYGSTAKTRLAPGGGLLIIQTRWNDADLSGMCIQQMVDSRKSVRDRVEVIREQQEKYEENSPGYRLLEEDVKSIEKELTEIDNWEIISYPAIAEHNEYRLNTGELVTAENPPKEPHRLLRNKGEALHPERISYNQLMNMKRTMQPRHWSALYQQNPVPDEGIFFTLDMFRYEPSSPNYKNMHTYIAFDLAIGEKQTNDWTVGTVIKVDHADQIHVVDMVRGRWNAFQIVEAMLDLCQKYDPQLLGIEKGQLEHAIRPQLEKRMKERKLFPPMPTGKEQLVPINDKSARAKPLQGRMQQGMVYFPENQPWVEVLRHEMLRFPGGLHDDAVDSLAWNVRMSMGRSAPKKPKDKQSQSWKSKLKTLTRSTKDPMSA